MQRPTPAPTSIRPPSSIGKLDAAPPRQAPTTYADAAANMVHFLPKLRLNGPARNAAAVAVRKSEEQNRVRSWLSNLQYWFTITCFFIWS
jgi:hypothetical protein